MFKDVMGCTAAHPPWLCKVFGGLPAGEREKLITDNRLCPFCLLHDKDRPCGAREKPVPVACMVPRCKGRHVQKLHDFLKDVFREENRVHVVQEDDGWEESDEAWELGEEEMIIVGMVQQEDDCSWQDACDSWMELEEEAAAGAHQAGAYQEAANKAAGGQCEGTSIVKGEEKAPEPDGLLLEGEEQEYFLELLMRTASPEQPKASQSARGRDDLKSEAATAKGKKKKRNRKKEKEALGQTVVREETGERAEEEGAVSRANGSKKLPAPDIVNNPEAKGRGLVGGDRGKKEQVTRPQATSGGECSG
jgi:hypothetical protein